MTQTQLTLRLIQTGKPWHIVDSEGKPVKKETSYPDLELLLICHKSGIRIVEGEAPEPVKPSPEN